MCFVLSYLRIYQQREPLGQTSKGCLPSLFGREIGLCSLMSVDFSAPGLVHSSNLCYILKVCERMTCWPLSKITSKLGTFKGQYLSLVPLVLTLRLTLLYPCVLLSCLFCGTTDTYVQNEWNLRKCSFQILTWLRKWRALLDKVLSWITSSFLHLDIFLLGFVLASILGMIAGENALQLWNGCSLWPKCRLWQWLSGKALISDLWD